MAPSFKLCTERSPGNPGEGYFHRNAIRGRAAQMGRFLTKNPWTWVPFLTPKSLNMGPFFVKITNIFWARNASPENFQKIPKHGSIFWAKSLNMGTFFTSKHGLGSQGPGGTPPSKPKSSAPPGRERPLFFKIQDDPLFKFRGAYPSTSTYTFSAVQCKLES